MISISTVYSLHIRLTYYGEGRTKAELKESKERKERKSRKKEKKERKKRKKRKKERRERKKERKERKDTPNTQPKCILIFHFIFIMWELE